MGIVIPQVHLGMANTSNATQDCRVITHLTDRVIETGQLHLQVCRHPEGRRHPFCLDATSRHVSLTEKLQLSRYADEDGNVPYFPHISLVGLPAIGDRPQIAIYADPRFQRHYILDTIIADFTASSVVKIVRQTALQATA